MAYRIEDCEDDASQLDETAEFLARFVAEGEVRSSHARYLKPGAWKDRFRWWWSDNPYLSEDSPRGLILRDDSGTIVGFFGFIPHRYLMDGKEVPSLLLTTSYVRQANRDAALGLFLRAHREKNTFQYVDGGPNQEAEAVLSKIGYQRAEPSRMLIYPINRLKPHPRTWIFKAAHMVVPRPNGKLRTGRLVTDPASIREVPQIVDRRIRKHVDRATLDWYLNSGSDRKVFAGWCDDSGCLQCYVIGIPWRKFGQNLVVIIDYAAFGEEAEAQLDELVAHLACEPDAAGLPGNAGLLVWPVSGRKRARRSPFSVKYDSRLFYRLPPERRGVERVELPFEGDKNFV